MTDWKLLEQKIDESGLKRSFIYEKLGISRYAWSKRKSNDIDFKAGEIMTLCEILHITKLSEREQIFFAKV